MSESSFQIIARGTRQDAEKGAEIIDADLRLEGVTFSILEEDERLNVWRIDAFPNDDEETRLLIEKLTSLRTLTIKKIRLADADWLAMALSGLPPVHEGRFVLYGR